MSSDQFNININGKIYSVKYKERNGDRDAAGFGYLIIDPKTEKSVGYLRVLIYGTASAMWSHHSNYPYSDPAQAEKTVKTAFKTVLSNYNFEINKDYFEAMCYRGDNITVQITTLDNAVDPNDALITLKSYDSPEDFVSYQLFGDKPESSKIRHVILEKINQWEELNYGLPYSTKDVQDELFLDRKTVHRAIEYLEGLNYISKVEAGDDEYNLKLSSAGVDYLEATAATSEAQSSSGNKVDLNNALLQGLSKLDKSFGDSYLQVIEDLNSDTRKTWKGTANELRELVSSVLRLLAPEEEVIQQQWYKQLPNTSGPTQSQKVKYILSKRSLGSKQKEVMKELESFDDRIGAFARKLYNRASNSTHQYSERKEIIKLYHYFVAFMSDLLDTE